MTTFTFRRWRNLAVVAALGALLVLIWWTHLSAPQQPFRITGWTLMGMMLFLLAYNLRKKLPFLPLANSSAWLQWHLYIGWLSIVVFLVHTGWRLPSGAVEITMAVLFWLTAASGVAGIWMSRVLARRMTARGESVLYERMGAIRASLRRRAEELVVESVRVSGATTLSDFYANRLADFFAGRGHMWNHLLGSIRVSHQLLIELGAMRRYLKDQEREILSQLEQIVSVKDDLDFQDAAQTALKGWLFVHIPLAYSLVLVGILHAALVHVFGGGAL